MSKGFKPHAARELLQLETEQFRYWRNNIDPKPLRTHFSASNIFAFRVIKSFVIQKFVPVNYLSRLDWSELFEYFELTSFENLKDKIVVLDQGSKTLSIESGDKITILLSNDVIVIFLRQVVECHIKAFLEFGDSTNVISISHKINEQTKQEI